MLIQVTAVEYLRCLQFDRLVREQTLKTHRKRIGALVMFWLHREVESITNEDIIAFKGWLVNRKCKMSYIKAYVLIIRAFFKYCQEEKLNVIDYKTIKVPSVPRQDVSYLTVEQVQRMLSFVDTSRKYGRQINAIIWCLLTSGVRIFELLDLNRDSINFETKTAEIIGKGSKKRVIVFGDQALEALRECLADRTDDNPALFIAHRSNVLTQGKKLRLKQDGVRHYLRTIGKKMGVRITPHMLRRTAATTLHFNGMNTEMVRAFLGHENIATTSRYLGVNYEKLKQEHKKYMRY